MVIIQIVQKIKTFSLYSIKKLFKLRFNKLSIFISLFLFSCTSHLIQAEEIKPENLKCGSSIDVGFFQKYGIFTSKDKDFIYKLRFISENLNKDDFNFIYISKPTGGGYTLELEKITKKKNKHKIYFKENKPQEDAITHTATAATYCFLKIDNLNKVDLFIK
tara:strand:+ start:303 stop:788 length:486 start_codon:yes stop_codon:yes gene_type:complete